MTMNATKTDRRYYAVVSFGGPFPGETVFASQTEAEAAIVQAERDTAAGEGDRYCDTQVLARARVGEYETREAAERADISDTTDSSHGRRTPGFVRWVHVRG
jgi:hypothetical protein